MGHLRPLTHINHKQSITYHKALIICHTTQFPTKKKLVWCAISHKWHTLHCNHMQSMHKYLGIKPLCFPKTMVLNTCLNNPIKYAITWQLIKKTLTAFQKKTSCGPQENPCGPQAESKLSGILCFPNRKLLNTDFKSQNVSNYQKYWNKS
jgi:hypothetical protein